MKLETASRITELRKAANLNKAELGRLCKVTRQTVDSWERTGYVNDENVRCLARVFNVSEAFIRFGEESTNLNKDALTDAIRAAKSAAKTLNLDLTDEQLAEAIIKSLTE